MIDKQENNVAVPEEESIWTNHVFDRLFNNPKRNLASEVIQESYNSSHHDVVG